MEEIKCKGNMLAIINHILFSFLILKKFHNIFIDYLGTSQYESPLKRK